MVRTIIAVLIAAPLLGCSFDEDHEHHDRELGRPATYREHRDSDWDRDHHDWDRHDIDHDRFDQDVYRDRD